MRTVSFFGVLNVFLEKDAGQHTEACSTHWIVGEVEEHAQIDAESEPSML